MQIVISMWRYAKESVRRKVLARELSDEFIEATLVEPDSVVAGRGKRLIAQKLLLKTDLGKLLIGVIYEENQGEKVVVTAYWARPERYRRGRLR